MLNIKRLMCNPLQENCYVVSDDSGECVIIDCGAFYPEEEEAISNYIGREKLHPVHLLATHGHLDHNFGNTWIDRTYGLRVEIVRADDYLIEHLSEQAANLFGLQLPQEETSVGRWLADGETISFGAHTLSVIGTPGHTPGSCLFWCKEEKVAFTGDTLFRMSIGRTDFDGGSYKQMVESLRLIAATLPTDTTIYCGHGQSSTIADELHYNPYLRV